MQTDNPQLSPASRPRQAKPKGFAPRDVQPRRKFSTRDEESEQTILREEWIPAIEPSGFWCDCWAGFVVIDLTDRRVFLGTKSLRRAMRRLIERSHFGLLIDVQNQRDREARHRAMWRQSRF